jgi:hypothetical protein
MPTPPISYDESTNTLTGYGYTVNLGEARVIFENGELYLPLRAVAEALGFNVNWDSATSIASTRLFNGAVVELNAADALSNGQIKFIDNHIYVPSAYVISRVNALM